ncbi:MAG: acyl carrier protein [Actinomycetota bacterium]|nr:acyl carrier protein [Actinomycetota bacterium]
MDRQAVLDQLTDVAVEVLGIDRGLVHEGARFGEDLDADSLDRVEIVMALEEKFGISVPEEKLEGIDTVGQAIDMVLSMDGAPAESADRG